MPQRTWEDTPQRLVIVTNCTSQNPMARITKDFKFQSNTYTAEDVCQGCMKGLAQTIADWIQSRSDCGQSADMKNGPGSLRGR